MAKTRPIEPNRDKLAAEFLEAIEQLAIAEYGGKTHKAFVAWYVEAEFGRVEWDFTDDAGDGGIDAVVKRPGERPSVVLIQSKFSERLGKGSLARPAYKEFTRVAELFHRRDDDEFAAFLKTVREDARRPYRKAKEALEQVNLWTVEKQAFRLITTMTRRKADETAVLPASAYRYADDILELYSHYRRGHTPRARDLTLAAKERLEYRDPRRGVTSFLFNANLADFRKYFENNDVARLVARNIRYNLAGKLGRAIRATFEDEPNNFWYLHNGITIICDECRYAKGASTLTNPSVVNGAQTLFAVSTSSRKSSTAMVPVRVVVRGKHQIGEHEDDAWVQKIIRGVNSQNRVRNLDFRSNEPEQLELQQLFRDQKVFYERKRGEFREYRNDPRFRGFERTSSRAVGMALAVVREEDGRGVADVKRGVEYIFEQEYYDRLFPQRTLIRKRFERIYLAYRIANFVRACGFRGAGTRKYRHAYWTAVWVAYQGVVSGSRFFSRASIRSIREGFDRLESSTLDGMRARAEIKRLRADLWKAWRLEWAKDRDVTAINFFKSRPTHRRMGPAVLRRRKAGPRRIGEALTA